MTPETRHKIPWDIAFQVATKSCLAGHSGLGPSWVALGPLSWSIRMSQQSPFPREVPELLYVDVPDLSPLWHPGGKIFVLSIPA